MATGQTNKPLNSNAVKKWLKEATANEIVECLRKGYKIWWCTLGPGDMIYIPAACMAVDRVLNTGDIIGLKMAFLSPLDKFAVKDLLAGILDTTTMGLSPNPVTKEAVKALEVNGPASKAKFLAACAQVLVPATVAVPETVSTATSTAPTLEQAPLAGSGGSAQSSLGSNIPTPTHPSNADPHQAAPEDAAGAQVATSS